VSFEEALRPEAFAAARQIVNLCGFFPTEDPQRIAALTTSFAGPALAKNTNASLAADSHRISRITQSTPLLIAQGLADAVGPPAATEVFVTDRAQGPRRVASIQNFVTKFIFVLCRRDPLCFHPAESTGVPEAAISDCRQIHQLENVEPGGDVKNSRDGVVRS
jgi:hypothetical protein